jgi:hypothetical protein
VIGMVLDVSRSAGRATVNAEAAEWSHGSGVIRGVPPEHVWKTVRRQLSLEIDNEVVTTGDVPELGALTHLLWWAPSVRAVLVTGGATGLAPDVEDVRRVIGLTGSDALLLVDASGSDGMTGLERDAQWADLVVVTAGAFSADPRPAALLAWSPRLAPALELLDGMQPLSYEVLARLR